MNATVGLAALVGLLALVALGGGGYAPWGTLVLELGAAFLFVVLVLATLWPRNELRKRRHVAWKKMPLHVRHPNLGRWLRSGRAPTADVEILLPGEHEEEPVELDVGRNVYLFGVPLRRTGLLWPLTLLSFWMLLATAPLPASVLSVMSPESHRVWTEATALSSVNASVDAAPWSVAPFISLGSYWIWIAVVAVFFMTLCASRRPDSVAALSFLFLILGAGFGAFGVIEWLFGLQALLGQQSKALRAAASFGNPNHYAAFQAMLLSISVGWLAYFHERHGRDRHGRASSHGLGLFVIAGLGVLILSLGLVMSLSRSGLTFALIGCTAWMLFTRESGDRRPVWALGLAAAGLVAWIGIGPLLSRFENLQDELLREQGRSAVWQDSLPAIGDYGLTGSGLGTFRYVGSAYRSFGGQIYYSWAHNDYLQLAIELGLPGFLLFLWIVFAVVRSSRRVRSDIRGDPALLSLHAGYLGAVVAIAFHSATDFSLHLPANLALLAMVVAVSVGLDGLESTRGPQRTAARPRRRRGDDRDY